MPEPESLDQAPKHDPHAPTKEHDNEFKVELTRLLNYHNQDTKSQTPDFILADFLTDCLAAWTNAVNRREEWYGRKTSSAVDLISTRINSAMG